MAIGIYFSPPAMTTEKYNECIKLLKKAGAGHPTGRSYHASFGPNDKLMVFDVWTSQAAFDKFGKTLMPILQQLGVESGEPHNHADAQRHRSTAERRDVQEAREGAPRKREDQARFTPITNGTARHICWARRADARRGGKKVLLRLSYHW